MATEVIKGGGTKKNFENLFLEQIKDYTNQISFKTNQIKKNKDNTELNKTLQKEVDTLN